MFGGEVGGEFVAVFGEVFEGFGIGDRVFNYPVGHGAAGDFGVEGDDFVFLAFFFFEDWGVGLEFFEVEGFGVFFGG